MWNKFNLTWFDWDDLCSLGMREKYMIILNLFPKYVLIVVNMLICFLNNIRWNNKRES